MRKTSVVGAILVTTSLASTSATAAEYELDDQHSYAYFRIDHLERGKFTGGFRDMAGLVRVDGKDDRRASVELVVQVASLTAFDKKREQHLLGPDFFDAKRYPVMRFTSTEVRKLDEDTYEVTGKLTIKADTKTVTARLTRGKTGKDMWGGYRTGGNVTLSIDRRDFGVGKPEFDAPVLGNTVEIEVYWEAVRK